MMIWQKMLESHDEAPGWPNPAGGVVVAKNEHMASHAPLKKIPENLEIRI